MNTTTKKLTHKIAFENTETRFRIGAVDSDGMAGIHDTDVYDLTVEDDDGLEYWSAGYCSSIAPSTKIGDGFDNSNWRQSVILRKDYDRAKELFKNLHVRFNCITRDKDGDIYAHTCTKDGLIVNKYADLWFLNDPNADYEQIASCGTTKYWEGSAINRDEI